MADKEEIRQGVFIRGELVLANEYRPKNGKGTQHVYNIATGSRVAVVRYAPWTLAPICNKGDIVELEVYPEVYNNAVTFKGVGPRDASYDAESVPA